MPTVAFRCFDWSKLPVGWGVQGSDLGMVSEVQRSLAESIKSKPDQQPAVSRGPAIAPLEALPRHMLHIKGLSSRTGERRVFWQGCRYIGRRTSFNTIPSMTHSPSPNYGCDVLFKKLPRTSPLVAFHFLPLPLTQVQVQ